MNSVDNSERSRPPMPGASDEDILAFYRGLDEPLTAGPCSGDRGPCTGQRVIERDTLRTFLPVIRTRCEECGRSRFRETEEFLNIARSKLADWHTQQRRRRVAP